MMAVSDCVGRALLNTLVAENGAAFCRPGGYIRKAVRDVKQVVWFQYVSGADINAYRAVLANRIISLGKVTVGCRVEWGVRSYPRKAKPGAVFRVQHDRVFTPLTQSGADGMCFKVYLSL